MAAAMRGAVDSTPDSAAPLEPLQAVPRPRRKLGRLFWIFVGTGMALLSLALVLYSLEMLFPPESGT